MKKLMLVDGSNVVMRAAFGGDLSPERAVPIATGLVERAVRQAGASHLIVALDSPGTSWRRVEYPEYKADRTVNTEAWLQAAHRAWTRLGWRVEAWNDLEADDIIATLATRAHKHVAVVVVSRATTFPACRALDRCAPASCWRRMAAWNKSSAPALTTNANTRARWRSMKRWRARPTRW